MSYTNKADQINSYLKTVFKETNAIVERLHITMDPAYDPRTDPTNPLYDVKEASRAGRVEWRRDVRTAFNRVVQNIARLDNISDQEFARIIKTVKGNRKQATRDAAMKLVKLSIEDCGMRSPHFFTIYNDMLQNINGYPSGFENVSLLPENALVASIAEFNGQQGLEFGAYEHSFR